jgi:predicted hotdog family 3-hydroxylacyl-ACP dehydratase
MVLLDEVVEADGPRVLCRVTIRPDAPFAEAGRVPGVIALEYMAQAIGVYAGLRARGRGRPPRIGYLLGTRELTLEVDAFDAGDVLLVEASHVWGDEQLGSFDCAVRRAGATVAAATINVYQGEEPPP